LTKVNEKEWNWTPEKEVGFEGFKERLTSALILIHFNPKKLSVLETNASNFALGAILSHKDDDGMLHPGVFYS
jgi:hypothetical protein